MAGSPSSCSWPVFLLSPHGTMKYEGKAASTETSSLVLPIRSHSEYVPGTPRSGYGLQWICCLVSPSGKSGCSGSPRTTHTGKVLCLVLASAAALTSDSRCGFYTLVLLLSTVTGRTSPHQRCTARGTCYSCSFSHANTNMHNTFTPSYFLTRTFQGAIIIWV